MGTAKRERQKANRALKHQEVERTIKRRKGLRVALVVGGALVAIFGLVWIVGLVSGDDEPAGDQFSPDALSTIAPVADDSSADTSVDAGPIVVECPPTDGSGPQQREFPVEPPTCLDPEVAYQAIVETNKGTLTIDLDQDAAPNTVNNFVFLARNKYFDSTVCHRIIPDFVVQCGDPTATGTGGPGYRFADELPEAGAYQVGSLAMANSGPDTNGSQFFIITGDQGVALPPQYSLFGQVTDGLDTTVVDMAAAGSPSGAPTEEIQILSVTIVES